MYTFLSLSFVVFVTVFLIGLIFWIIRRKGGKLVLYSFFISLLCLIFLSSMSNPEEMATTSGTNNTDSQSNTDSQPEQFTPIVDAKQFALIDEEQLINLLGEPEARDEWNYKNPRGQEFKAITLSYNKGNQEFMFIDGKLVRFTYYGEGQTYENNEHALALFGIDVKEMQKIGDTGSAIRYRGKNDSTKVDDFWLTEGLGENNTIDTVKITYDASYF
nr:MAG: hypothetical protein DIU61_14440 [Bacteroidota bacterium]